jgi:hypothetical protein
MTTSRTTCLLVAAGMACAIIADEPQIQAKEAFFLLTHRLALQSASVSEETSSSSQYVRVADDYCNTRCEQQFKYCQYRAESPDHCVRVLTKCRANC